MKAEKKAQERAEKEQNENAKPKAAAKPAKQEEEISPNVCYL